MANIEQEIKSEAQAHETTFEKIQEGKIDTPEELGESIVLDHIKENELDEDKRENYKSGFFPGVPHDKIKDKAALLAAKFGEKVYQAKSGTCYFNLTKNGFEFKIRFSDHIENIKNRERYGSGYDMEIDIDYFGKISDKQKLIEKEISDYIKRQQEYDVKKAKDKEKQIEESEAIKLLINELNSEGYFYHINYRTYMDMSEFINKKPDAIYIRQTLLDYKNQQAYKYEWIDKYDTGKSINLAPMDYLKYIQHEKEDKGAEMRIEENAQNEIGESATETEGSNSPIGMRAEQEEEKDEITECLRKHGLSLEKDHHFFGIASDIYEKKTGRKFRVIEIGDLIKLKEMPVFKNEKGGNEFEVSYSELIEKFKDGEITIDGFDCSEVREFARVLKSHHSINEIDKLKKKHKGRAEKEEPKEDKEEEKLEVIEEIKEDLKEGDIGETIEGFKVLLSMEKDKKVKKEIKEVIKGLETLKSI